ARWARGCRWCPPAPPWVGATRSRKSSIGSRAETRAAQLARLHQTHEETVELAVLLVARLAQPRHRIGAQAAIHGEALAQDADPLAGEILGLDPGEAGARQQRAIPRDALDIHRRHPDGEPPPLAVVEP